MRNFVVKNDFNRSSYHKDKKNDYTRKWDIKDNDLEYRDEGDNNQHGDDINPDKDDAQK